MAVAAKRNADAVGIFLAEFGDPGVAHHEHIVPEEDVGQVESLDEGRRFVFVHHIDDYYLRRPVLSGRSAGGSVEILEGLEPGQQVVAGGAFLLKSDVLRSKMGEGCAH